jgi:hypothetical protein
MIKLNLIPIQKKEEIKKSNYFRLVLRSEIELFGIILIFAAMLLNINYILKVTLDSDKEVNAAKNAAQNKEIRKYDSEIREINEKIREIGKIQEGQLNWSNLFEKLNGLYSNSIEMKRVATRNYLVLLEGKANNRDNLIAFKENLEKEECFSEVNLPLSSLVSRENVEFQIDFKIKKECLKEKG